MKRIDNIALAQQALLEPIWINTKTELLTLQAKVVAEANRSMTFFYYEMWKELLLVIEFETAHSHACHWFRDFVDPFGGGRG